MKGRLGLWIDNYKAVIITVESEKDSIMQVNSNLEKHIVAKGENPAAGSAAGKTRKPVIGVAQERMAGEFLGKYYEAVLSLIRDADSIWLLGPGDAKVELRNLLKRENLSGRVTGMETVKKMTDRQIAQKVHDYYQWRAK